MVGRHCVRLGMGFWQFDGNLIRGLGRGLIFSGFHLQWRVELLYKIIWRCNLRCCYYLLYFRWKYQLTLNWYPQWRSCYDFAISVINRTHCQSAWRIWIRRVGTVADFNQARTHPPTVVFVSDVEKRPSADTAAGGKRPQRSETWRDAWSSTTIG